MGHCVLSPEGSLEEGDGNETRRLSWGITGAKAPVSKLQIKLTNINQSPSEKEAAAQSSGTPGLDGRNGYLQVTIPTHTGRITGSATLQHQPSPQVRR